MLLKKAHNQKPNNWSARTHTICTIFNWTVIRFVGLFERNQIHYSSLTTSMCVELTYNETAIFDEKRIQRSEISGKLSK